MDKDFINIEFEDEKPEQGDQSSWSIKDFLDGSVLTKEFIVRQLPYIMFLTILAILYIGNRYHAEKIYRRMSRLESDVKELRSEWITTASELMRISKQTTVVEMLEKQNLELISPIVPPKKINNKKKK